MTIEPTLFGNALRDDILEAAKTFKTVERIVIDKRIQLDGKWFDAEDIDATLEAVCGGDVAVDSHLGDVLVKLKVLTTRGNRNSHGAEKGENFDLMVSVLRQLLK